MEIEDVRYKKRKQRSPKFKAMLAIFIILIVLLLGFGAYLLVDYFNLDSLSKIWNDLGFDENEVIVEYETDPEAANLEEVEFVSGDVEEIAKDKNVTDILLIGVDNRNSEKFTGRSDVLILLRIDNESGEVKLASFMRDTLVKIEGHDKNRINTAYSFGSIELAYDTMERNFGIKPDYYMVVNFFGMEDIINSLDGVDININKNEISNLNACIDEINKIDSSGKASHIKSSGMQHLNGRQAVAYMRIRKVGLDGLNGDAARVSRQQIVLTALFNKAKSMSVGQLPEIIEALSEYVRTDIPLTKMIGIGTDILDMQSTELQKFTYPDDFDIGGYKGMSIVQPADFEKEILKLKDFLE